MRASDLDPVQQIFFFPSLFPPLPTRNASVACLPACLPQFHQMANEQSHLILFAT
jgi:hypothetical protein